MDPPSAGASMPASTWPPGDEVRILKALAKHRRRHTCLPQPAVLFAALNGRLEKEGVDNKVLDRKRRSLERRYFRHVNNGGAPPAAADKHERRLYNLSTKVWGPRIHEPSSVVVTAVAQPSTGQNEIAEDAVHEKSAGADEDRALQQPNSTGQGKSEDEPTRNEATHHANSAGDDAQVKSAGEQTGKDAPQEPKARTLAEMCKLYPWLVHEATLLVDAEVLERVLPSIDEEKAQKLDKKINRIRKQITKAITESSVHMGNILGLQNRFPTVGAFVVQPSIELSTEMTVVPRMYQSHRGDDGTDTEKVAPAIVPTALPDSPCAIDLPSLDAEKSNNIHAATANENRTDESEEVPFHNHRVEDSGDLEKRTVLPTTIHTVLVKRKKDEVEEDLNLICKKRGSPIDCNTKATDNMEMVDMIPNQADSIQYYSHSAGYHENAPTFGQENNRLGASACTNIHKNWAKQIMPRPPTDTKVESLLPEIKRNVEPAAFLQEATRCNHVNKRNLNYIAEHRESMNLNHREKTGDEGAVTVVAKNGQDTKIVKQRDKRKKSGRLPKDVKDQLAAKAQKGQEEPKPLPSFEGFLIEKEEGSGGYGTVYRARRRVDGKIFAIKCPHPNSHPRHINNELKMLERFGGKNFVIKIDSSFRSGDLECFVLQHVEHDRPEILKKEIDMLQLQCYGYCLFRALASLHKQEVVHRDVKPGNFLFSRKMMKGYLIDFNLANDLHQKFLKKSKSETISCEKNKVSQRLSKFAPMVHAKEAIADSKQPLPSKRKRSSRSPVGSAPKIDNKSRHGSQAADLAGLMSAKDPTSTKASLDRLKQPMFYKGRKELMNFLNETIQSPNNDTSTDPVSQRKRVAAPLDRKLFVLTPMPLRSGGSSVAGSGMFNNKGHGKHRREGPCGGTKGFRAPEVLFKSFHQGCKVDVWSAGVTLLFLIIGRTPFGGDPEQNIKEIAKLRGSEELWELAKLHSCESSYPWELSDVKSLHSVNLKEWCAANTRRQEFLKMIPEALLDLVDKCLAVNPRRRLSSGDALMHEFFAPLRDSLRKQRVPRRSVMQVPPK